MKKNINILSLLIALLTLISTCVGLIYTSGGTRFTVANIYGQKIELYGDGIYAYNSVLKAGTNKGTDLAMLLIAVSLIITVVFGKKIKGSVFIHSGLLALLLYYSTCIAFGVTFNRLFLIYLIHFSATFFAFIFSVIEIMRGSYFNNSLYQTKLKGTGVFLIISGCSVLVWLSFIIPAVVTGKPMEIIEIYTTEPTFVVDLGIILPSAVACGILLLKGKTAGYKLAPVLLTLMTGVGLCVIGQTIMQSLMGIVLPIGQMIGLVGSFVIIGTIAVALNIRMLKYAV